MATKIVLLTLCALLACGEKRRVGNLGGASANDATAVTPAPRGDAATPVDALTSKHWVMGYYAAYQREALPPSQIDWSGLSHVVFTRLKTDGGGRLQHDFDVDAVKGPAPAPRGAPPSGHNGTKGG